jgi:hypothetical protein
MILADSFRNEPVMFEELFLPALNAILYHEMYHHAIEVGVTPYMMSSLRNSLRYDSYFELHKLYKNSETYRRFEEKSCNSFVAKNKYQLKYQVRMNGSLPSSIEIGTAIRNFMRTQPPGYRDFEEKISNNFTAQQLLGFLNMPIIPSVVKEMAKSMSNALHNGIPKYIITSSFMSMRGLVK